MHATRRTAPRGFTLIELLVVVAIIALVSAIALPTILPALNERRVSESARVLQAILAGTRDAAIRANAPRGIRLLPDPVFNGTGGMLASNRIIPIEPGPDYTEGLVSDPNMALTTDQNNNINNNPQNPYLKLLQFNFTSNNGTIVNGSTGGTYLMLVESDVSVSGTTPVPNNPTSWSLNVRQGDKIRFNDSGVYYTIAGPINGLPFCKNPPSPNTNTFGTNALGSPITNSERAISCFPASPGVPLSNSGGWIPEFLFLMNGQDDNGNGWIDEGCDGIDNDGDGITDPGFNGLDDNQNGIIDEPLEMMIGLGANGNYSATEFEQEVFLGAQTTSPPNNEPYTIFRRPVVSPGAREVTLPAGVVIDLTTWNASSALNTPSPVLLPERSRLPVDPFTYYVDIMIDQTGRVIPPGAGSGGGNTYARSPVASSPFYHFWLTEREGVQAPLWDTNPLPIPYVPMKNPNYGNTTNAQGYLSSQNYLLPMPKGTQGYPGNPGYEPMPAPYAGSPAYLIGERRLVTLFVKTGQITSNSIQIFNVNDTNAPFYDAQSGTKESQ